MMRAAAEEVASPDEVPTILDLDPEAWEREYELERRSQLDGITAFRKSIQDAERRGDRADVGGARRLLAEVITPAAKETADWLAYRGRGRPSEEVKLVRGAGIEPEALAYIAARFILTTTGRKMRKLVNLAKWIGEAVEEEARVRRLPPRVRRLPPRVRRRLRSSSSKDSAPEWPIKHRFRVGHHLIDHFIRGTKLATIETAPAGRWKTTNVVRLTEAAEKWIAEKDAIAEILRPRYLPMVVSPKPWRGLEGGGYWSPDLPRPIKLVRGSSIKGAEDLSPGVLSAVNAVQETPWRVNTRVLDVVQAAWGDPRLCRKLLVRRDREPLPDKPADIATNLAARKDWCKLASPIHARNERATGEADPNGGRGVPWGSGDLLPALRGLPRQAVPSADDWPVTSRTGPRPRPAHVRPGQAPRHPGGG
jgi:DNA-directed RNA polymerase